MLSVGNMAMKNVKIPKAPKVASTLATIGPIGLYAVFNSLYTVEGWHRAVMFNSIYEVKEKVYTEGTHLMIMA
ncbi:hypothetical protein NC651_026565 [Populus alba x Populus x berolinensis]|nr:hypothetical protein NC651_026565 [Populus alba x Populus x berolinensis]